MSTNSYQAALALRKFYRDEVSNGQIVVLYHANCVDGFYAHTIVAEALGDLTMSSLNTDTRHTDGVKLLPYHGLANNYYIPVAYEDTKVISDELLACVRGKYVIVVDFSFEISALKALTRMATSVLIIDHHKTLAERVLEHMNSDNLDIIHMRNLSEIRPSDVDLLKINPDEDYLPSSDFENLLVVYDGRYCASLLTKALLGGISIPFDYFESYLDRVDNLTTLHYINDYDLYTLRHDDTKPLWAALHNLMYAGSLREWYYLYDTEVSYYVGHGLALLAKGHRQLQSHIENARIGLLGDQQVVFVNATSDYTNDIGEALSNLHGLPVAIWHTRKDYTKVSLRSSKTNGDFDVGKLAQLYGGGGHRNAASFSIPIGAEFDCRFM